MDGTPIDLAKMRSIGVIGKRTKPVVREGRSHPETGAAWKTTSTEAGSTTEHNVKGDRVDAVARPETVTITRERKASGS